MVTRAVVELLGGLVAWLVTLMPSPSMPDWYAPIPGYLATLGSAVSQFSYWIPVSLISTMLVFVTASRLAPIVIRIVRVVVSLFTGGGGSAA